ncbi:MAG: FG-GAP repeat domain-containing protein [Blastocatellia bacterium]
MKRAKWLTIFFLLLVIALATFEQISQNESQASSTMIHPSRWSDEVTVISAERGNPWINVTDGREIVLETQDLSSEVKALQVGGGSSLSAATADFDEDGMPDLVMGHTDGSTGAISFLRGNVDSVYPNTRDAEERKAKGVFTSTPFLGPARVISTSDLVPDIIVAGDFDADGHFDVAVANRDADSFSYFRGDGGGGFEFSKKVSLSGRVTAMIADDVNRRDGLNDVIVGLDTGGSGKVLFFEHPYGSIKATPEVFDLASPVTLLSTGYIEGDARIDLVVAAGNNLTIIRGRDRKLMFSDNGRSTETAILSHRTFDFRVGAVTVGEFIKSESNEQEIALLADDGKVYLLEKGGNSLADWREKTTASLTSELTGENLPVMLTARVSARSIDTLVIGFEKQIHLLTSDFTAPRSETEAVNYAGQKFELQTSLDSTDKITAILPMRLNLDALSDLVVMKDNSVAPTVVQTAPMASLVVDGTSLAPDEDLSNNICCTVLSRSSFCRQKSLSFLL